MKRIGCRRKLFEKKRKPFDWMPQNRRTQTIKHELFGKLLLSITKIVEIHNQTSFPRCQHFVDLLAVLQLLFNGDKVKRGLTLIVDQK
jgi:hypothetical protein